MANGGQKIGEMNGVYARMLKIALWGFWPLVTTMITCIGIFTWWFWRHEERLTVLNTQVQVESEVNRRFRESNDIFTQRDGMDLALAIGENRNNVNGLKDDIQEIRDILKEIRQELRMR